MIVGGVVRTGWMVLVLDIGLLPHVGLCGRLLASDFQRERGSR